MWTLSKKCVLWSLNYEVWTVNFEMPLSVVFHTLFNVFKENYEVWSMNCDLWMTCHYLSVCLSVCLSVTHPHTHVYTHTHTHTHTHTRFRKLWSVKYQVLTVKNEVTTGFRSFHIKCVDWFHFFSVSIMCAPQRNAHCIKSMEQWKSASSSFIRGHTIVCRRSRISPYHST